MSSNFHTKTCFPRAGNLNTEDNFVADHMMYVIAVSHRELSFSGQELVILQPVQYC